MNNPLISIIIPTYNCADYLADTIKSVLAQTYGNVEILVVDDGSTDNTQALVNAIRDPRIRLIIMPNHGNYFVRNKGLSEARGEYIAFLDADDLWVKNKLAQQLQIFESYPDVDFCCTGFKSFKSEAPNKFFVDRSVVLDCDDATDKTFIQHALTNNFIVTSSVVARRRCFDTQGEFDTAYQNAMDYDLWLRIILNHKAYYLSEAFVLRRDHRTNIGKNHLNTYKALGYIFEKLITYKDRAKFYLSAYDPIVNERLNLSKYQLGLEYLLNYQFADAFASLASVHAPAKADQIKFCCWVAKNKHGFFIPLLRAYRQYQRDKSVVTL